MTFLHVETCLVSLCFDNQMGESAASAQKTPRRKICGATLLSNGLFSGALSSQSQPIENVLKRPLLERLRGVP